jgi:glycosyltransferase involved in cell wall biosynthesis
MRRNAQMQNRKRRLCIILPQHWSYLMGGSQYQIKCLLEKTSLQTFFDIFILSRRMGPNYAPENHQIQRIVKPYFLQRYGLLFDAPFLLKKLNAISPDVIYQNIGTSYAGIAAYYARRSGCKMVLHIASDNDIVPFKIKIRMNRIIPRLEKYIFDYAVYNSSQLIAQTFGQKHLIHAFYHKKVDAVIPNFLPIPEETLDKQLPIKIIWVANFKKIKQPEIFIRLAEDIQKLKLNTEFIMIGNPAAGGDQNWQYLLEKRINAINNLSYLGGKNVEDVEKIIAKSHVLVNTSKYEGFSNTFIQAWMRCVPVVSLNSNPDGLLDEKKMGLISGSYEQLYKDVILLIQNEGLRKYMGKEAQKFSLMNYTMNNADALTSILLR